MKSHVLLSPFRRLLFVAIVAFGVPLASCGGGDSVTDEPAAPVTIQVDAQEWTGWSREQPKPKTRTTRVVVGDTIDVDAVGGSVTFTVSDINEGRVSLSSDQAWSLESDGGGIDLNSTETEFEVSDSEPLKLSTPSMDGGTTVTFTLD